MISTLFALHQKVAVITGGTGVLGSAMAQGLASAGAKIALIGRRKDVGESLVNKLKSNGHEAISVQADVLNEVELTKANDIILQTFGRLDILVNAAGGNLPGATISQSKNFFDLNINDFKKVVDLNLIGTVLPSKIFGKQMALQKQGVIVNISSMAADRPLTRVVGYAASKSAVDNFTKWLCIEMVTKYGEGIRVNAIAPGFFLTDQNRALLINPDGSLTERAKSIVQNTPFARFGKPEELIGTLVWLCSDASAFVTGIVVPVDGGFSAFSGV